MLSLVSQVAIAASAFTICIALARFARHGNSARASFPPGPRETNIILGNVSHIPTRPDEWKKYHDLSRRYGPVMHLRALHMHIIVLDTMQAAVDLLEKRGAIYSDRPRLALLGELMGYNWQLPFMKYGNFWRKHRRALHQHMNENAITRLHKKQERINTLFLRAVLDTPGDWWSLTHWLAGASILSALYGYEETKFKHDPWVQLGEDTLQIANSVFAAGLHPVDIIPFHAHRGISPQSTNVATVLVKHIPSWFPGAAFKRKAKEAYKLQIRAREDPYAWVKERMREGTAIPSITSALLDAEVDGAPLPEQIVKNTAGVAYISGADTSLSTIKSFILAMVRNPDTQRKAQQELDRVIPSERLPTPADRNRSRLPYLEAVLCETYRKYPPVPLGHPHRLRQEDEYRGMRIPSGAIVIANIWAMMQDGHAYGPDAQAYRPERFLKDGHLDPSVHYPRGLVFGFGRRICPGRYFADAEIWLLMATLLYCFDILPALDDAGRAVIPPEKMTDGTVIAPVEFQCCIVPRSAAKQALIVQTCEQMS